jgi:hypothetical protein
MSEFVKCECPHCGQPIEYPVEGIGQTIPCPSCEQNVALNAQGSAQESSSTSLQSVAIDLGQSTSQSRFIAATCPHCGGDLQVPSNRDKVICMYCGGPVVLRQPIQREFISGVNVENLMELAQAAAIANNFKEAYDYYTKILEVEPRNPRAWAGKGEAAGWTSTLAHIKTGEMITALSMSISYADESEKPIFQKGAADVINRVTFTIFGMAKKHLAQFVKVSNAWPSYVKQCGSLFGALEVGHGFDPGNKATLENIIHIAKDNLEGISYSPDGIGLLKKKFTVSREYAANLKAKINECSVKLLYLNKEP